jgi:hypothetical protein
MRDRRQTPMTRVIVAMTTSLDGFVTDPDGSAARLYPDLAALRDTPYMKTAIAETGAVRWPGTT